MAKPIQKTIRAGNKFPRFSGKEVCRCVATGYGHELAGRSETFPATLFRLGPKVRQIQESGSILRSGLYFLDGIFNGFLDPIELVDEFDDGKKLSRRKVASFGYGSGPFLVAEG